MYKMYQILFTFKVLRQGTKLGTTSVEKQKLCNDFASLRQPTVLYTLLPAPFED